MVGSLFAELKRRNVFKAGAAYLAGSWLTVEVVSTLLSTFGSDESVMRLVVIILAIGLVPVLVFAWVFDITPDGIRKESEISPEEPAAIRSGRKLDFLIIGLMTVALGYFIYESRFAKLSNVAETTSEESAAIQQTNFKTEGTSIAVMAFDDMSPDRDQEYLAYGISEEILNVLAKLPHLKVISRSSAFSFKGKDIPLSEVAKRLGASNILEGSVRKAGNRIRITAQLIDSATDTHLWSESYDRELTDIFAVQDEISAAIVEVLKAKLGLDARIPSRDVSSVNPDAHNEYLRGKFYIENRKKADIEKAMSHFEKSISLDSDYAPAWVGIAKGYVYLSESQYGNTPVNVSSQRARPAAERAIQLNPDSSEAQAIMGLLESSTIPPNIEKAEVHFEKAIELNPNYAIAYSWYSNLLTTDLEKSFELRRKALRLNPMSLLANDHYAQKLILVGRVDEAIEIVEHMFTIDASSHLAYKSLGRLKASEGKYAEASVAFEKAAEMSPADLSARFMAAAHLAAIGLAKKAAGFFKATPIELFGDWYLGDDKTFIRLARASFPRSEKDSMGLFIRALAETRAGNFDEASRYFDLSKIGNTDVERIFSYLKAGEDKKAKTLVREIKTEITRWSDAGASHIPRFAENMAMEMREMEVAYLDGDLELAIANLGKAVDRRNIIRFEYKALPMYKELREHPEWPAILAESERRAANQREIYQELVGSDGD